MRNVHVESHCNTSGAMCIWSLSIPNELHSALVSKYMPTLSIMEMLCNDTPWLIISRYNLIVCHIYAIIYTM